MPRCRANHFFQHQPKTPQASMLDSWNKCTRLLCCCILLGMAVCNPQAAAPLQQQERFPRQSSNRQQQLVGAFWDAVLPGSMQLQQLRSQLLRTGDMQSQGPSIAAAKWLLHSDKQLQEQLQQQQRTGPALRRLFQYKPSAREQEASRKDAGHMSGWHAFSITLLCFMAMAALGAISYKALQWYERTKRPGYVELQAMDTAYHKPWVSL